MTQTEEVTKSLSTMIEEETTRTSELTPLKLFSFSRSQSPSVMGSNTQCGSALATEIDSYRRRIQTLLHFFDCIAQHWWDQLYPYKNRLIKRPSKSADEVRSYRSRLLTRLNKFTMRGVIPAAAAIATMEAHATVKVLPLNLLSATSADLAQIEATSSIENTDGLLRKAFALARRLGDIEKLKQRLILAALTWITSDGRDFALRAQRVALLCRHTEPCLIEHYDGVRALLTHYYRPRILTHTEGSAKHTPLRVEPITAARLTSTNEQILQAIKAFCLRIHQQWPVTSVLGADTASDDVAKAMGFGSWNDSLARLSDQEEDAANPFPLPNLLTYNPRGTDGGEKMPILPSIVLNPLSIDTSHIDWLSYEINQREFNLHVLNMEEPEGFVFRQEPSPPPLTPLQKFRLKDENLPGTTSVPSTTSRQVKRDSELPSVHIDSQLPSHPIWTAGSPLASPVSKDSEWSGESHEFDSIELDTVLRQDTRVTNYGAKRISDETAPKVYHGEEPLPTRVSPVASVADKLSIYREPEASSYKSGLSSMSLLDIGIRPKTVVSPGGEGEGPIDNLLSVVSKMSSSGSVPLKCPKILAEKFPVDAVSKSKQVAAKSRKQRPTLTASLTANEYVNDMNQTVKKRTNFPKSRKPNAYR